MKTGVFRRNTRLRSRGFQTALTLDPELVQQIENFAGTKEADTQAFVEEAIRAYLLETQQRKIREETEAFDRQRQALLEKFAGQYVAVHHGAVIDHDPDLRTLQLRVFEQLGQTPVLLMKIRSHWGESRRVLLYLVDVRIGNLTLPGVEVVGDPRSDEIIVGRDILNRLHIVLDGPGGETAVSE